MRTRIRVTAILAAVLLISCAANKPYLVNPPITEENDARPIPKPKEQEVNLYEDAIINIFGGEIDEFANLSWHVRKATNRHKQAKNINALGEVPNSTWFTNRNGQRRMSLAAIRRGPNRGAGPDTSGLLWIIKAKVEGASPGFRIRDQNGDVYFVKFDMRGHPQLTTAAEIITTKFVYASGYNTPENYLSALHPDQLEIAEGVTVKNRWGRDVPMTFEWVERLLERIHPNPDGTYRMVASKRLPGEPIGPFRFNGTRSDDPNDHIPHHHRRELRGYKVIAAWLNSSDSKANNTLDMFIREEGERGFVKHYLLDFGTSLGSGGTGAATSARGQRGAFDLGHMLLRIFTLGLYVEPWEKEPRQISPSIGYFSARHFDPDDYAFIIPNPAFQKATELDEFWAAKIVMSFSDEQIRAVVETAQYENPEDEEYMINTLIARRDIIGRYWYEKVNPLDHFRFDSGTNEHASLMFDDLAVDAGFEDAGDTRYRVQLRYRGEKIADARVVAAPRLTLDEAMQSAMSARLAQRKQVHEWDCIFTVRIKTSRRQDDWGKFVDVHFYYPMNGSSPPQVIAIDREN